MIINDILLFFVRMFSTLFNNYTFTYRYCSHICPCLTIRLLHICCMWERVGINNVENIPLLNRSNIEISKITEACKI